MIERLIILGLVNSTEFAQQIRPLWDSAFIISTNLQRISTWCIEYYDQYQKAPGRTIEDIYFDKKDSNDIPKDLIESLEEDLEDLAEEFDETFNLKYALEKAGTYLQKRHLELHQEEVESLKEAGDVDGATALASSYKGQSFEITDDIDLSGSQVLSNIDNAFSASADPLLEYPGALGRMFNDKMIRGGFVAYLASEKRGKSFWLLDMAIRATVNRSKVAFFQAGDMTEGQQLKRICSYLAKKPISDKYTGEIYVPVEDCILNQLDLCDKEERRCDNGVFTGGEFSEEDIRKNVTKKDLIEAFEDFGDDYQPCTNCEEYRTRSWGTPWLVPVNVPRVLTVDEAKKKVEKFFINKKRRFKISTHPNSTLSVGNIRSILNRWEQTDGFIPDVVIVDYADLLITNKTNEFRHQQNEIWKDLRALSQERNVLVLTATQADAKSYDTNLLKMSNFSEDKRKWAHITAGYGMNQDAYGREKKMGLLRFNELVVREGEFDSTVAVTVLQNLNLGRPYIGSFI